MDIINDNTFNLHNSLLNSNNRYMKVTLKFKLMEITWYLISAIMNFKPTYGTQDAGKF